VAGRAEEDEVDPVGLELDAQLRRSRAVLLLVERVRDEDVVLDTEPARLDDDVRVRDDHFRGLPVAQRQ
jgi:hypothetical protein